MRKKRVAIAGLGLVLAVIALLMIWSSLRPKPPEPTRQEVSSQPSPDRQTPDVGIQPQSQNETAQREGKGTATPKDKAKGRARGADGGTSSFSSASWVMEQQRIGPTGLVMESSMSKVWIKGEKKRVETFRTIGSWSGTSLQPMIVVLADKDFEYAYYPSQQRMLRVPRTLGMEALSNKMVKKKSEARVGSEVVDGKVCATYRVVNIVNVAGLAKVPMEVKECRWRGLVLKEVSRTLGSSTADTLVTQLKDVQLDLFIPDEKFVLPAGVKIQDVQIPPEAALRESLR